jgi:hypothetical protein
VKWNEQLGSLAGNRRIASCSGDAGVEKYPVDWSGTLPPDFSKPHGGEIRCSRPTTSNKDRHEKLTFLAMKGIAAEPSVYSESLPGVFASCGEFAR